MKAINILYITDLNLRKKGGLFNATYERIKLHSLKLDDCYIINNNSYDSFIIRKIKRTFFKKKSGLLKLNENYIYDKLTINNLNFKRNTFYYFKRILNIDNSVEKMISLYYKEFYEKLRNIDIIHAHWGWPNGYIAYKLAIRLSIPYFITFHGSDINYLHKTNESKMVEAMEYAEKCFFVSNELLNKSKTIGYSGANSEVIYNGVDLEKFKLKKKIKRSYKTVGFIGSLEYKKGADLLPQIFKKINDLNNREIRFLIVGDGSLSDEIKFKFKKIGNIEVSFTGNVEPNEVPYLMERLDLLIVPSRNEGLGMVILESNAVGVPVVGTNVGGIPEAIGVKSNIIDLKDDLISNVANRAFEILFKEDYDIRQYRNRVEESFNWLNIVEKEFVFYKNSIIDD